MFSLATLLLALAASCTRALPLENSHMVERSACSLSTAKLNLPPGQTALAVPSGKPQYVALGVGVQVCVILPSILTSDIYSTS